MSDAGLTPPANPGGRFHAESLFRFFDFCDYDSRFALQTLRGLQLAASGNSFASVSNDVDSRGRLTGLSSGEAVLTASCGTVSSGPVSVIVSDSSSSSDELSFSQGDSTELVVGGSSELLRVSTGSIFNSSNELDQDDLTWELSVDNTSDPAISLQDENSGTNAGRITPLSVVGCW